MITTTFTAAAPAPSSSVSSIAAPVAPAQSCGTCCLGEGQCDGLTRSKLAGSCCPTGSSCCLSQGSVPAFGAFTCCANSDSLCSSSVKYSNSIVPSVPATCVARSTLLCKGHSVVTKATSTGRGNVELRCGVGHKTCPGPLDFCDTTNYLPRDPLIGVCCRDESSASAGCAQKTDCASCARANCFWNLDTNYCHAKCEMSSLSGFASTVGAAPQANQAGSSCISSEAQCGSSPTDTCRAHCGEITPDRFNKPPPASLLTQGLQTPKVAGDMVNQPSAASYPGAAAILGKPDVGRPGCLHVTRKVVMEQTACANTNQFKLAASSEQGCEQAVLADPRCGPFFTFDQASSCHCLSAGEVCEKSGVQVPNTNVYSLTCGGARQPDNYPFSAITSPWINYQNSEQGPYNSRPYSNTANGGGFSGRRLLQWNPFWFDPVQPQIRAPVGPRMFGPSVYRPRAGAPAPDPAWVVVQTSYLEETLEYSAKGGKARTCSCDPLCNQYNDCCRDYEMHCLDISGGVGAGTPLGGR
eukprot:CAMPEP_0175139598 /NCGR_PEP_ID=MMETSP0087-20121206/10998_1 /TAXON_ID=136419 /ORGANISM="Unknown Unknown, Strain D1" /LENGTH=524 /DNA_ID=CAMNT_0016422639 /DNA_START=339 /DNA_END=1913 /DNA_ORIENTATION=-